MDRNFMAGPERRLLTGSLKKSSKYYWGTFGVLFLHYGCKYFTYFDYFMNLNILLLIEIKGKDLNIH